MAISKKYASDEERRQARVKMTQRWRDNNRAKFDEYQKKYYQTHRNQKLERYKKKSLPNTIDNGNLQQQNYVPLPCE